MVSSKAAVAVEVEGSYALLRAHGWVVTDEEATAQGLISRLGEEDEPQELLARVASDSRPGTHSAQYGLDAFPWHSDGALARCPPHFIVLRPVQLSRPTGTELLDLSEDLRRRLRRVTLLVQRSTGRRSYFPALLRTPAGTERLRWDARAKVRGDAGIAAEIASLNPTAVIPWEIGRVAVIDNHRLLHRRPPVSLGRRLSRTYIGA